MPTNLTILADMLTYCRPSGSVTETDMVQKYIATLPDAVVDAYGNWHVQIEDSPILWSCHTDTVHGKPGRQTLHYANGLIGLSRKSRKRSWCLGADDTAGLFLCHQMIHAGVPGHYVFHHAEEIGGIGSSNLTTFAPEIVEHAQFAIALDRKGTRDVITYQSYGRCCSDAFARSLADELNKGGLTFAPSEHGVFTDTANYVDVVGECTNLSVGYEHAHSNAETLNVEFLDRLFAALCAIDASKLVASRVAGEYEASWPQWTYTNPTTRQPEIVWCRDECIYCGIEYDQFRSTADDTTRYCSLACEYDDARMLAKHSGAVYLDPEYQDVQDALRKPQLRLITKG